MRNLCISIVGPTAVGKTEIALQLAQHFSTSIISADSRQCFKELNIGVAKPSAKELAETEHFFINSHHIWDEVTAATFEQGALDFSNNCFNQSKVIILAGGTGLYVKAFLEGLDDIPPVTEIIRQEVAGGYENGGILWLHEKLKKEDPLFAEKGEMLNPHRCMRALEVVRQTGKGILSLQQGLKKKRPFELLKIGLELPRELLYQRINSRVDEMMAGGLEREAQGLLAHRHLNALQTVGYRELFECFDGKIQLPRAVELIMQHTRHYAKRQLTWFKRDTEINWMAPKSDLVFNFIKEKTGIA